ncbi:hypothetical protein L7F22_051503 [Adiantum nelumboides]|nr:hypothetical protein [Adiantum nelumboides]
MFLLVALPNSWDTFCTAINNSAPENGLNCADVESSLLMEELNCKNVDDSRVRHNLKLRMIIPLKFKGRNVCLGLINGGTLWVLKKAVPPYVEVDVNKLKIEERILMNDLNVDLAFRRQAGYVVCKVKEYRLVRPNKLRSLARREFGEIVFLGRDSKGTSKNSQFWFLRS